MNASACRPLVRISVTGRILLVAGIAAALAGGAMGIHGLLSLGAVLMVLPLVALPYAFTNLKSLQYERTMPDLVAQGESVGTMCTLHNRKTLLSTFSVRTDDALPRAGRKLQQRFAGVLPRNAGEIWESIRMPRRGVVDGAPYVLHSRFPFGLVRGESHGVTARSIAVYPLPTEPEWMDRLLASGAGHGGASSSPSEGMGEFRAMREYQPGDPARLISWPVSSRRRELVVREMELPTPQHVAVVFHSYRPPGTVLSRQGFEDALSMLSGIAHGLQARHIPLTFTASFTGWKDSVIQPDDSAAFSSFLCLLASARLTPTPGLEPVEEAIRSGCHTARAVWVVSNTPRRFWIGGFSGLPGSVLAADNAGIQPLETLPKGS